MFHLRNSLKLLNTVRCIPIANSQTRNIARWVAPTLRELARRRKKMGEEPPRPRSSFLEWNHNAELFSFAKRLNEDFDRALLLQAFTHRSYISQEMQKQKEVGIENPEINLKENHEMIELGEQLLSNYVAAFLQFSYPKMPEIGLKAIEKYLLSDDVLAHVSSHIGTKDLILSAEFPVTNEALAQTFKALVCALQQSTDDGRAFLFVRDFLLTQLNQKDLLEVWNIEEPMKLLGEMCENLQLGTPEPRLIGDSAKNTILACSYVGIYCNKQLLSKGFGENVHMAIDVAALNGINKLCNTEDTAKPLNFGVTLDEVVNKLHLKSQKKAKNL
ncbi:large ribosomal subunit protein mL44 [Culicoides brevitarsis]|uniref:large ribosomal subunit protein mL44 n=1 Tax=Culicoides brevitarsis TaxID=469753 RepID=UPI00307C2DF5